MLDLPEQFRSIYETAGFTRPVSVGTYYKTGDDVSYGFGILTAPCRQ